MECCICKAGENLGFIKEINGYKLYQCARCGIIFSDPMKNPGSSWYENAEIYQIGRLFSTGKTAWYHNQFLKMGEAKGKNIMDLGCGFGQFLNAAKNLGYDAYGIDFDTQSLEVAREKFKLTNISQATIEEFIKINPEIKFDYVTFFEVLEHVASPVDFINGLKKLLKTNGQIAFSFPNRDRLFDPLGEDDNPPNHLTKWNENSLIKFLDICGFEAVKLTVKDLKKEDFIMFLKSKFKTGLIKKMIRESKKESNSKPLKKARILNNIKETVYFLISLIASPVFWLIYLVGAYKKKGGGIYCQARLKLK